MEKAKRDHDSICRQSVEINILDLYRPWKTLWTGVSDAQSCGCTSVLTSVPAGPDLVLALAREGSGTPGSHQGFDLDGYGWCVGGVVLF